MFLFFLIFSGALRHVTAETIILSASFSLRMMAGIIMLNLILQTILYFLKHYLRFRKIYKRFLFGLVLHIPTTILWLNNEINGEKSFASITAAVLSGLVSGLMYLVLNGRILRKTKMIGNPEAS